MRFVRFNEPRDPELFRISKVVPDRWIDEKWPQHRWGRFGRWKRLRVSQIVRVHFLALLKHLSSFNCVCRELKHNIDFRRFCRLRGDDSAPTPRMLSDFRQLLGTSGWKELPNGERTQDGQDTVHTDVTRKRLVQPPHCQGTGHP